MQGEDAVLEQVRLGFPWQTLDPFLFCVHHDDAYPAGNGRMGPAASLEGRNLGSDFDRKDGWSMYHGRTVPGFPRHPHRGFETVTLARRGLIDHSDSLGAAARFGRGDAQWLTAGRGIVHAEMFPLLDRKNPNPVELFQIWLNLPRVDKMAEPHFAMLWSREIPKKTVLDAQGRATEIAAVAGTFQGLKPPSPPPKSWAARPDTDIAIWTLRLDPGAHFVLPPAKKESNRMLYFFRGKSLTAGGKPFEPGVGLRLRAEAEAGLINGEAESELLLLQGRPIGEPVAHYGPFVMNSSLEIRQAFSDYQQTEFGGWPWKGDDSVHPETEGRFARHADGALERPA